MQQKPSRPKAAALAAAVPFLAASLPALCGTVDPDLAKAIAGMKPGQEVAVIVSLSDRVALAPGETGTRATRGLLVSRLKARAAATQPGFLAAATALGARSPVSLWAVNAVAMTVGSERVNALANLPGVDTVRLDVVLAVPSAGPAGAVGTGGVAEWNVAQLHAPDLWSAGIDGTGTVVATLDTGADPKHPDLGPLYRGGTNSWFDPSGQHATPADVDGHGTRVLGLLVGGSSGGSAIGVAPGARWIAAKIFDDQGRAPASAIHQAFQWLLDPDGDPATDDAPDVVNASWGYPSTAGTCWTEFAGDIDVARAAGIEVVFAAGNDGGALGTSESPANNPGVLSAGAVDSLSVVAPFSSRGPSACDGSTFPSVVAGGVSVRTSDLTLGGAVPLSYATVTGTSFAAPQVAGAVALLAAAHPTATLGTLEAALRATALDLGVSGPDPDYGAGLPDVGAASLAIGTLPPPPSAQADSYSVAAGATLTVATPGVLANDTDPSGLALTASLAQPPRAGSLSLSAAGGFTYTAPAAAGTYTFSYVASDGVQWSAPAAVSVVVSGAPQPPVASGDSYGTTAGSPLAVAAPGVLANDSSPSGQPLAAVLLSGPSQAAAGTFALKPDGSFTYATNVLTAATDSFTYAATDGTLSSPAATVTIAIAAHPAPVARDDAYAVARNAAATALAVLANDTATGTTLVGSSVKVTRRPNHGGTAKVNADGTVSYKPARSYQGKETFSYTVKDALGSVSNAATVTVTVG